MMSRSLHHACFLLALAASACGGAVDRTETSSGSTPAPGATAPAPTPAPAPPSTGGPVPAARLPNNKWNASASGCGNFTVFAGESTGHRFLVIQTDKQALGIASPGDTATIDLSAATASTKVFVDAYDRVPGEQVYCTDFTTEPHVPVQSTAIQGTATFTIEALGNDRDSYLVTVALKNVIVRGANGALETLADVRYSSVAVGWLPG